MRIEHVAIWTRDLEGLRTFYERWFGAPIPPKNTPLNIPMTYLLKDLWKYPTDWGPG